MRTLDIIAATLLVVGGLNWGLVGLFDLDLVARLLGGFPVAATVVYVLVGLAALYQAASLPWLQKRWHVWPRIAQVS